MKFNEKLELISATEKRLKREKEALELIVKQRDDITRPDWETVNSKFNTQRRKVNLINNELIVLRRNKALPRKGSITSYRFSTSGGQLISIDN